MGVACACAKRRRGKFSLLLSSCLQASSQTSLGLSLSFPPSSCYDLGTSMAHSLPTFLPPAGSGYPTITQTFPSAGALCQGRAAYPAAVPHRPSPRPDQLPGAQSRPQTPLVSGSAPAMALAQRKMTQLGEWQLSWLSLNPTAAFHALLQNGMWT